MRTESSVSVCETHLSRLFFTPDRVFKLLKPVKLPFVDFSETEARCRAATTEYERNKIISPDVYLGLADVREQGELTDRMIVMRRLDADRELGQLLRQGLDPDLITSVARYVSTLHSGLPSLSGVDAEPASLDAIAGNWEDNLVAIKPHCGSVIEPDEYHKVASLARAYMAGRAPLFQQRVDDGWVRDGHGDLRAEHIYCTDAGPRAIDCVAFEDRYRIADSLSDVAFLAMDLDRLVGPQASVAFMRAWNEFTNESHPSSLAHFYVAYRAHVRCKIACLRHAQGDPKAAHLARTYHELALRHLEHARIRMVIVGGGPGSGKSTIAEGIANRIGAVWLRSDEIRKDVAGVAHTSHAFEEPDAGIYSPDTSAKTMTEIIRQTEMLLRQGVSVVVDATWRCAHDRAKLRALASQSASRVSELRCDLPAAVAKERIARRMASVYNPSDATPELVDYLADRFEPWPEATAIDTSGSIASSLAAAWRAVIPVTAQLVPADERSERFAVDLSILRNAVLVRRGITP